MTFDPLAAEQVDLAERATAGLSILLCWGRESGKLWVDVLHLATGRSFIIPARPDNALDVFYHPFAYDSFAQNLMSALQAPEADDDQAAFWVHHADERAAGL